MWVTEWTLCSVKGTVDALKLVSFPRTFSDSIIKNDTLINFISVLSDIYIVSMLKTYGTPFTSH